MNDGMCFSRKRMEAGQAGQHLSLLKLSRDCIPNWPILSLGLLCFCRHLLEDKVLFPPPPARHTFKIFRKVLLLLSCC